MCCRMRENMRRIMHDSTADDYQQGHQTVGTGGDRRQRVDGPSVLAAQRWPSAAGAAMGIKLVTEVLDCYHGEDPRKLWLIAWAEKANDRTRAGWPTRQVLSHRTGRDPTRVSHIASELVAEGVLKRDGGGNRGGPARFILLPLASPGKGAPSTHPLDAGGASGSANSQPEVKGAPSTHPSGIPMGAPSAHPKVEIKGADPTRKGAESAIKGADPTLWPAETGSLPLTTTPSEEQPSEPLVAADAPTAQTILGSFIDWVRLQGGDLTRRTSGQLARQIGDLLEQDVPDRFIRKGLADWYTSGHNPATFDSFANAALNAAARNRAAQNGHANGRPVATADARRADAEALKAKRRQRDAGITGTVIQGRAE
jgi:hypothetical protein